MGELSAGRITLWNESLHELFPNKTKYKFELFYDNKHNITTTLLIHKGIKYPKKFDGTLFLHIYNAIKSIYSLPFNDHKAIYYGDEFQIDIVIKGKKYNWRNLSPRNCLPNYLKLHAGSIIDLNRQPYNEFQLGQTEFEIKHPPTPAQNHYDYIIGLIQTIMETLYGNNVKFI